MKQLKKNSERFIAYDKVIPEQLEDGIVEKVLDITPQKGKEFYLPHKAIIREDAKSTKLRVVYDASSKPNMNEPSLNECLEKGPPMQNMLRDALVTNRMKPVALCADLRKAFLQIRIRKCGRNILRFHWIKNQNVSDTEILRFTRLVFGLIQSPFILEAILQSHLSKYEKTYPKEMEEIKNNMYVNDMISGGNNEAEVVYLKNSAKKFVLHKWYSNNPRLEEGNFDRNNSELSYAKQQLGSNSSETKVLGIHWNKVRDTFEIRFPLEKCKATKCDILRKLASIYDSLGFVSPVHLMGKIIYRMICEKKLAWDNTIPSDSMKVWDKWKSSLIQKIEIPRSIFQSNGVTKIDLHVFCDSSKIGYCAVGYIIAHHPEGSSQGLIANKSRLAKQNTAIPRLELIASHIASNLAQNL